MKLLRVLLLLLLPSPAFGQLWSGVISTGRAIDWSTPGVPGGIPTNRTQCGSTIAPYTGSTATINTALSGCAANTYVQLAAGTFTLSTSVLTQGKSNVTLRGMGANQTFLVFTGSSNCWGQNADVCFMATDGNWSGGPDNTATLTGGGPWPAGTTQITLSSVTNLSVGNPLILDQVDDLSDGGVIYDCEQSATFSSSQNPPCNDDSGATGGDSGAQRGDGTATPRGMQQIVTVTAINGTTVTFSPGLYMPNWAVFTDSRGTFTPGAWWVTAPAKGMGIENLSLDHTNSSAFLGTQFYNCSGCWAKGVRSLNSDRDHFAIYFSDHVTVRDSYMYGTKNTSSQSYGIEDFGTSMDLEENNIAQHVSSPYMVNSDCEGCVIDYNYAINDFQTQSANTMFPCIWEHSETHFLLAEGNECSAVIFDLFHGTHHFTTYFRNRFSGHETNGTNQTTGNTNPFGMYPFTRFINIIGNVIGAAGYHTTYTYTTSPAGGTADVAIYMMGTGPQTCCQSGDANVAADVFRWGNFDTVNSAVRFVNAEVPSGLAQFANAVPATHTLPASFVYQSTPPWWPVGKPWPLIGPDVAGGNVGQCTGGTFAGQQALSGGGCTGGSYSTASLAGHAFSNPAYDCFVNVMGGPTDGTGAALTFNAGTCYAPPAPPALTPSIMAGSIILNGAATIF